MAHLFPVKPRVCNAGANCSNPNLILCKIAFVSLVTVDIVNSISRTVVNIIVLCKGPSGLVTKLNKKKKMPKKTIAIVPEYAKTDNFSKMSIMWLNYMSNGANIQHALNGGEKVLTIGDKTYKVDGFCEETNTVYEFYGCFWHGCPNCYKPNIINSKSQRDMGTLNDQTIGKRDTIKNAGYNHVSTYECQLTKNKDFQKFAKNFTQEIVEHLIHATLSMEDGQTQRNSCTILKKMSVDATWIFALYIQQSSTIKNIQLVTLPKYSTPKSMTDLGTVLSNAK